MRYLADTVAIIRYLRAHPALGKQAAKPNGWGFQF
jgi:hypothetical protein